VRVRAALKEMVEAKEVERSGGGKKGDPFLYAVVADSPADDHLSEEFCFLSPHHCCPEIFGERGLRA